MRDRPYFLWDLPVTEAELRERLRDADPEVRAQWQGRVMREARYDDVWSYLTLGDVLRGHRDTEPFRHVPEPFRHAFLNRK